MPEHESEKIASEPASDDRDEGIRSDPEIRDILEEAENDRPLHLEFPEIDETEDETDGSSTVESIQNPKKAHQLYYAKKERLLKKLLPEGDEYDEARRLIRDQVNLYLKEGHESGRDGRQAHTHMMEDVVVELQECIEQNVSLFDTYSRLEAMNKEAGHLDK